MHDASRGQVISIPSGGILKIRSGNTKAKKSLSDSMKHSKRQGFFQALLSK